MASRGLVVNEKGIVVAVTMTRQRDPAVLPKRADVDYPNVALSAWLDAQINAVDAQFAQQRYDVLVERITNGKAYLEQYPNDRKAQALYSQLHRDLRSAQVQIKMSCHACWYHCCNVYAALQHVPHRGAWIEEHAPGRFLASHPADIWAALLDGPPPGEWPPGKSESYFDNRLRAVSLKGRE